MIEFKDLLTSSKAITVYVCSISVFMIGLISYYTVKNRNRRLQKQNTKELNESVTQELLLQKESPVVVVSNIEDSSIPKEEPVTIVDNGNPKVDVIEALNEESATTFEKEENALQTTSYNQPDMIQEQNIMPENVPDIKIVQEEPSQELVYAPIELNKEEAKEELERLTMELTIKAELEEKQKEDEKIEKEAKEEKNISLTNFEKEQEENAIISIDELMSKANDIYSQNEVLQYEDEGNEPISIADLQAKWEKEQAMINQINKEEQEENKGAKTELDILPSVQTVALADDDFEIRIETKPINEVYNKEPVKHVQFPSIVPKQKVFESNFQNSPVISPVYGIDRKKAEFEEKMHPNINRVQDMQLENTANYEKFDEEIKKTNEFIAALKELQKKLD